MVQQIDVNFWLSDILDDEFPWLCFSKCERKKHNLRLRELECFLLLLIGLHWDRERLRISTATNNFLSN